MFYIAITELGRACRVIVMSVLCSSSGASTLSRLWLWRAKSMKRFKKGIARYEQQVVYTTTLRHWMKAVPSWRLWGSS